MTLPVHSSHEVDVQVSRKVLIRLRQVVVRVVVKIVNLLSARPTRRITGRLRKLRTEPWPPLVFVPVVKGSRIGRGQSITAYALLIFEHQRQPRLEPQIGPDKNPPQSIRILPIKRFAVVALIAGFQADEVSGGLVARTVVADCRRHKNATPELGRRSNL